ncbi:MAG: response regulator, partial [Phaeodactylibacter sp.]|nr:response regulator [Phaeodactylibacter sp.]
SLMMDFDEKKIQNILNNLLSNALKFTPGGGRVVVHAHREIKDDKDFLKLKVRDTGVGIAPDKLPYVFDRFFQVESSTTRQGEGTGIGLAFTKELVELLKGRIEVESQPEKGTTFTVSLPIHQTAPQAEPSFFATHDRSRSSTRQTILETEETVWPEMAEGDSKPLLLIVEDNLDVTTYIRQILEPLYQVHTATNGRSGIDKAMESIPDIIISDVMMPEVDGLELVETLKNDQRTSHIPIILLTAKATDEDRISGLRTGADAYLLKPFHKEELFVRLEKLVELRKALQQKYSADTALPATTKASQQAPGLDELFIQKIREAIAEKMGDPGLGIVHLCHAVQLSNTQVFRKLKALTGLSPGRYILKMRLQKARTLLQTTDLNVSEVAYETGFTDPNYFSRAFRKEFDASPSAMHK